MKAFALAAVTAVAVATPAFAQDTASAPFTGLRVEGLAGYDNVGVKGLKNPTGVAYGVGVGYDFDLGGAVLGIEGEATDSTAKKKYFGGDVKITAGRDFYIGGRVGAKVGDSTLLYFKAGYTNARVGGNEDGFKFHTDGDGVRLGVGAEYMLSANLFLKLEYRYSNYEQGVTRNQGVAGFGFRF